MDHKGFGGIADTESLRFCIIDYIDCHIRIRALIHIYMTVSDSGLYNGNSGILDNALDKSGASSGEEQIYIPVELHEFRGDLPGGVSEYKDDIIRELFLLKSISYKINDSLI